MADINIEYVELTDENINDINKYINVNSFDFDTYFTRLCREIKDKNNYLYYTFNAIEILDNIFYFGLNNKQISFVMENDDNYFLIFNKIENPLVKFKILSIIYNIHDDKNNSFKSKNIGKYINFLKKNWNLYIPYFTDNSHNYTNVFTNLISLLKKSGSNESYAQLIEKLIDKYCNLDISDDKINIYSELFVHIDKKYHERLYHKLIAFINNILDNNIEDKYSHAEQASITARKFCKLNSDDYWKTYELEASVYIKQSDSQLDSNFSKADLVNKAYLTYRQIDKKYRADKISDNQMNELIKIIRKLREDGIKNMIPIYDIPIGNAEEIRLYVENQMKNKTFFEALSFFASISNIANYNLLFNSTKKDVQSSPFLRMVQIEPINNLAQTKKGHIYDKNQSDYENYLYFIIEENIVSIDIKVNNIIYPALNILLNEHSENITKEFIYNICNTPLIEEEHKNIIVEGLYLGFNKNYIAAMHILIPQIEYLLRTLLSKNNIQCELIDNNGNNTYKTLNTMLSEEYREIMWQIIGPHIYIDLKTLLDDEKGGLNLRNDLSHGLLSYDACNSVNSIYLWWLTFTWLYFAYNNQKR